MLPGKSSDERSGPREEKFEIVSFVAELIAGLSSLKGCEPLGGRQEWITLVRAHEPEPSTERDHIEGYDGHGAGWKFHFSIGEEKLNFRRALEIIINYFRGCEKIGDNYFCHFKIANISLEGNAGSHEVGVEREPDVVGKQMVLYSQKLSTEKFLGIARAISQVLHDGGIRPSYNIPFDLQLTEFLYLRNDKNIFGEDYGYMSPSMCYLINPTCPWNPFCVDKESNAADIRFMKLISELRRGALLWALPERVPGYLHEYVADVHKIRTIIHEELEKLNGRSDSDVEAVLGAILERSDGVFKKIVGYNADGFDSALNAIIYDNCVSLLCEVVKGWLGCSKVLPDGVLRSGRPGPAMHALELEPDVVGTLLPRWMHVSGAGTAGVEEEPLKQ